MRGPLEGLRIADFSQLAQGPFSTQILGDLGADIIKIEPLTGDWMRHWSMGNVYLNGHGISYLTLNRNKRSIALDLKNPKGNEAALRLIGASDALTENFRPGVMDRLGLGYEELHQRFPELIYVASSGFGPTGPYLKRPGQDLLAQAISGTTYLAGHADGPPVAAAVGVSDFVAGFHIVIGVLAGIYGRTQHGIGQRVDVNLLDSTLHLFIQELAVYLNGGGLPQRSRAGVPSAYLGAPYGFYETRDGYIAISMNPIGKLAELTGVPGYEGVTETQNMERRDEIVEDFRKAFPAKTTQEWLDLLLPANIWCAPVQDFADLERDPQVAENEMIIEWDHPEAGKVRTTGVAIKFSETPGGVYRHAPILGEHTVELLREVGGYSDDEIRDLQVSGAVA